MLNAGAMLFFMVLLLAGLLLEPAMDRLRIPRSVFLVVLGFAGSELATRVLGIDTGIRWHNFGPVIFHVFLPVLIFEAALRLDVRDLARDGLAIFLLAVPLFVATVYLTGFALYHGIGHPTGFPWAVALLAAVVLSGTDPHAVVPVLRKAGAPHRVVTLIEGEGAFGDAVAIVLFMLLLAATMPGSPAVSWPGFGLDFLRTFFGGIGVGLVAGGVALTVLRGTRRPHAHAMAMLAAAYCAYLAAQDLLGVSGAMAVLAAGLVAGAARKAAPEHGGFVDELWDFMGRITGNVIYLMAGVTITLAMFREQWLAMLIGIGAVLAVRAAIVFGLLGPLCRLPGGIRLPPRDQAVIVWSGARGTMTLALALSLPLELEAWYTVQSAAYGVVLFTLFVQAATLPWLVKRATA
jgi:CPA1 family monovalent cation:H+ antiporter